MAVSLGKYVCILLATSSVSVVNLKLAIYTNPGLMALRKCLSIQATMLVNSSSRYREVNIIQDVVAVACYCNSTNDTSKVAVT